MSKDRDDGIECLKKTYNITFLENLQKNMKQKNTLAKKLAKFYKKQKEIYKLNSIFGLLEWDQQANLPNQGSDYRSEQMVMIANQINKKIINKKYIKNIKKILGKYEKELSPKDLRSLKLAQKECNDRVKLPKSFIEEFELLKSSSYEARLDAKKQNKPDIFIPNLKKIFDMSKKYAEYINPNEKPYNVLLDIYEEGLKVDLLDETLDDIGTKLKTILDKILQNQNNKTKNDIDDIQVSKEKLKDCCIEIASKIGFDMNRGMVGEVYHPFETSLNLNDVRINTNFKNLRFCITSFVHELGHGLYEQNISTEFQNTNLQVGASHAIHESQSRFLENIIGKSQEFVDFLLPILQKYFPSEMKDLTSQKVYDYLNFVNPSLIRTKSDEVTYNFHIMLRYKIEKEVLNGTIEVSDIPNIRNDYMSKYLGIKPKKHSDGFLQDVHRSGGAIGYFPTYSLGNLTSAQFLDKFATQYPDYKIEIKNGNFKNYFERHKENIRKYGKLYNPQDLIQKVTGEKLNPKYFIDYISHKYL